MVGGTVLSVGRGIEARELLLATRFGKGTNAQVNALNLAGR